MKNNRKHRELYDNSLFTVEGQPETAADLINKYGTYNIQPTAESENEYPAIAQGYPRPDKRKNADKK